MNGSQERPNNRRQWLRGAVRYAAVAGISVLSASLLIRRGAGAADARCPATLDCGNCSARRGCKRPQRK